MVRWLWVGLVVILMACRPMAALPTAAPVPAATAVAATPVATATTPAATPAPEDVHTCDGAGRWFPAEPDKLASAVDDYLAQAEKRIDAEPLALIVPHAGYVYSGWIAAYAYKEVEGHSFDTVVVIGDTHAGHGVAPISVWARGTYETPLGAVAVDEDTAAALIAASERIAFDRDAHRDEHPVENQIPFLQRALKPGFRVVPIVVRDGSLESARALSRALVGALAGKKALVVASTDLAHWPAYDDAVASDAAMLDAVLTLDPETLLATDREWMAKGLPNLATTMCSKGAVLTAMLVAPRLGANRVAVLKHGNSGDTPFGQRDQVVGYGAVMFWHGEAGVGRRTSEVRHSVTPTPAVAPGSFTPEQRAELLRLARDTLAQYFREGTVPQYTPTDPALSVERGAFVTLEKFGQLRGCVGNLVPRGPLYLTVQRMALAAAFQDRRFAPLEAGELPECTIEVSVLSPLEAVDGPEQIEVGVHGVVLVKGGRQAVYLPQVAPEQGWTRDEMLSHLAEKAGLPPDAWREGARFYVFTAEVFGEEDVE